jgi:glycosyltransferase involved in cell wall biosynthesis
LKKKLAIISTHPIQYNAPVFRMLAQRNNILIKVFYTWGSKVLDKKFDPGFGKEIEWDIPLLDGYDYSFVSNISKKPGSHHFNGIDNPTLNKEIEDWGANAILVFGWSFKSHLNVMRHFKGKKKIIFRGDSTLLDEATVFSVKKTFRYFFLKWLYRYIDIALYVGSANKAYYLKYGLSNEQLFFAPHAIDNARFINQVNDNKEKTIRTKKELGIPGDAIVFLFAGKFVAKKNPVMLLDAFVKLDKDNTHLLLVGNGVQEEDIKMRVASQKEELLKRVHMLPFQNQSTMPDIYSMADVFCLISQGPGETWGLAVNEAMACSKAILVSNKCGCANDLIKDAENGYIIKSNNADDLYSKMKIMSSNKNKLDEMGKQSLQIIKGWSYEKICCAIENVIS